MSMLTPSGMGGKYRVTGNAYPRMRPPRRRGKFIAVLIAAVVVLGLFGWGALQLYHVFRGDDGSTKASSAPQDRPSCAPAPTPAHTGKPVPLPQPAQVTIGVYNATTRGGLAKSTADQLASRGFKVAKFGNAPDPYDGKVTAAALVVAGPAGEAAAREAGTMVSGSQVKIDPHRKGSTVDVMIGNAFGKLATPAEAAQNRITAQNPPPAKPVCTTPGTDKGTGTSDKGTAKAAKKS
ncbi:LytR C-terminal domain-containing protein [Actinacidiphila guanduensis]|uniref:LytR cell envelope-related transcriptional attenuator n=1 Tax=Actinacidiphila guanduensis TaxID=310781 RepID=A0A1G9XWW0_9ACTN|nr:LytR C-terminal domain-containing protein [Actinacidiphila guanduensis]SDN01268.1 LytR cell envelope-related transcriptional attenuator [Actinacidiphila guanduensis]